MLDSKVELLRDLPIFDGLSEKQLRLIVNTSAKAFFVSGENIISRDEAGDTAFLVLTGSARCIDFPASPGTSTRIGPGALIGELAMLVDTIHSFTVQAIERVRAIAIHRQAMLRVMERDPAIAQKISDNLLLRLSALANDLRRLDSRLVSIEHLCTAEKVQSKFEFLEPSRSHSNAGKIEKKQISHG
jgi:CRP/FNR family cyclic AMP-dependent transcriptional regulator